MIEQSNRTEQTFIELKQNQTYKKRLTIWTYKSESRFDPPLIKTGGPLETAVRYKGEMPFSENLAFFQARGLFLCQ